MKTLFSIQILRAIAACAVALAHIHGDLQYHMGISLMPVLSVGGVGVDIFFVISGFIMVYVSAPIFAKAGASRIFLLRRICRIVPFYWAAITLYILIVLWALARGPLPPLDWTLASYLFIPFSGANETFPVYSIGWTLNYEMFFYIVFAVAIIWPRRAAVAIISLALVTWTVAGSLVELPAPAKFLSNSIVLEFVLGVFLGLAFVEGIRLPRLVGRLMIATAILILAFEYYVDYLPVLIAPIWPPRFVGLGIPALLIVGGATLQEPRALGSAFDVGLGKVGDASYAIYLLHPLVFILARHGWPGVQAAAQSITALPLADIVAAWIYATFACGITLGLSILAHTAFERPITMFLTRQLVGKRKASLGHDIASPQPNLAPAAPLKE